MIVVSIEKIVLVPPEITNLKSVYALKEKSPLEIKNEFQSALRYQNLENKSP